MIEHESHLGTMAVDRGDAPAKGDDPIVHVLKEHIGQDQSFNSRIRDELMNGELFLHLDEMKYVVDRWRMDYNHYRPRSSLAYMTSAAFAELCYQTGCIRPHTPMSDEAKTCGTLA